jgi:hypothetical protein
LIQDDDPCGVVTLGRANDVVEIGIVEPIDQSAEALVNGTLGHQTVDLLAIEDFGVGQAERMGFGQRFEAGPELGVDFALDGDAKNLPARIGEGREHGMDAVEPDLAAAGIEAGRPVDRARPLVTIVARGAPKAFIVETRLFETAMAEFRLLGSRLVGFRPVEFRFLEARSFGSPLLESLAAAVAALAARTSPAATAGPVEPAAGPVLAISHGGG